MGVFVSEDEEKLVWKKGRATNDKQTEPADSADDAGILPAEFPRILTASEGGNEDVGEKIVDHDKDHGETAERADFGNRTGLTSEETDEDNGDLPLKAEEDRVRGLIANEPNDGVAILGIFRRIHVNHGADVTAEHQVLNENGETTDGDGDSGVKENKHEQDQNEETNCRAGKIDDLNFPYVGAQSRNNAQNADGKLDEQTCEQNCDQHRDVSKRSAILDQHEIQNRGDDENGDGAKLAAHFQRRVDQLAEAMGIVPDAAADGNQADADADIGEQVDGALHGIGDGEVGVVALVEIADEKNAGEEADHLHDALDENEIAQDACAMKGATNGGR